MSSPKRSLPKGASCSSSDTAGVCSWKAIPYAEPLNQRFAPSTPMEDLLLGSSSNQELNGGYGPMCFQWFPGLNHGNKYDVSEDCLTLNIWAPYSSNEESTTNQDEEEVLKPVIVWIHGGSFLEGGHATHWSAYGLPGNDTIKLYDGTNLVRASMDDASEILVVSVQYRLGPFGFLVQPPPPPPLENNNDRTSTTGGGGGGANGFGDIITALQWMKKHISDFGGDPNQITLMGEGSGAVTACALLHSPITQGLFHRVILQSGNCYPSIDYLLPPQEAWNVRERFLEKIYPETGNYNNAQEFLLDAPAEEIFNRTLAAYSSAGGGAAAATGWIPMYMDGLGSPSVDGRILPKLPIHLTPHPDVDVLAGVTSNDKVPAGLKRPTLSSRSSSSSSSSSSGSKKNTEQSVYAMMMMLEIENLRKAYEDFGDEDDADLFLDACIRCQSQQVVKRVAAETTGNAFWYNYDCPKDAAPHGSTSMAVLGNIDPVAFESDVVKFLVGPPPSKELIHRMQKAWISFATTGNPGWEEASKDDMGARIGCQETKVEPLIDVFGRCDNWTEWANAHGPQSIGSICMRESSSSIIYIIMRRRLGYAALP
ncbi:MAG: hypothetical protein SGBAC_011137 [Bacillariaceae sp.]